MPERVDLERLMTRYQTGDMEAAAALVRAASPPLYRFLLHRSPVPEDAADLLQDTWLRIHRSRHTYRSGDPVLPWLYGITRHVQIDGFRRLRRIRSREQITENLPELAAKASSADDGPSFQSIVAALPESQREVITMLKVAGMTIEEVARATASTVGAVKQKSHRAYEKLRQILRTGANGDNRTTS